MFDTQLRRVVDDPLNFVARHIAGSAFTANRLTVTGAMIGLAAAYCVAMEYFWFAALLVVLNRIFDGLDGAVARINGPSDWGGYLDSLADYLFYISIPVAFGIADPVNLLPALLLVASFTLTAVSFLAFAAIAAKLPDRKVGPTPKAFIYSTGLMEGGETIVFYILFCILPDMFGILATMFAFFCFLTVVQRIFIASRKFS